MGKRTKSKPKQKKKSNRKEPVSPLHPEILGLIETVDDNADLTGIATEIPPDHILDQLGFPLPIFDKHSIAYLTKNLTMFGEVDDGGDVDDDWSEAWSDIVMSLDGEDCRPGHYDFSTYSNKMKNEFRNRMIDIITRRKREVMYRKYVYALKRDGREEPGYHQEGDDYVDMGDDAAVDVNDDVFNDVVDVDVHDDVDVDVDDAVSPDVDDDVDIGVDHVV